MKVADAIQNVEKSVAEVGAMVDDIRESVVVIGNAIADLKRPAPPAAKICRDCRHCAPSETFIDRDPGGWFRKPSVNIRPAAWRHAECAHPSRLSVVDGTANESCIVTRGDYGTLTRCGPEAKWFEPRSS